MRAYIAIFVLAAAAALCNGATITWTGLEQNNQWTSAVNWSPAQVPGPNDDVVINSGNVLCTISTGVNSLKMGYDVANTANLTLFQSFAFGSGNAEIQANGNLIIASGSSAVTGTVNIDGGLVFTAGSISGEWTVGSKGTAYLNTGGMKTIAGAEFVNSGTTVLSGVLQMNSSSVFQNKATASITGAFQLMSGGSGASFDLSGGNTNIDGQGTVRLMMPATLGAITVASSASDAAIELYDAITFSGSVTTSSSLAISTFGSANVTFITGLSGNIAFSTAAAAVTFSDLSITSLAATGGAVNFQSSAVVNKTTLKGANFSVSESFHSADVSLYAGHIKGDGVFSAAQADLKSNAIISSVKTLEITGTFNAQSPVATTMTVNAGQVEITSDGVANFANSLLISGKGSFVNNGKMSVTGQLTFADTGFSGNGVVDMAGGAIHWSPSSPSIATLHFSSSSSIVYGAGCPSANIASITAQSGYSATVTSGSTVINNAKSLVYSDNKYPTFSINVQQ